MHFHTVLEKGSYREIGAAVNGDRGNADAVESRWEKDPGKPVSSESLEGLRFTRWVAVAVFLMLLVFRWCYARSFIWDSDEPQHLHVVWAWANGLLPYRDVFDNHTPLFHILSVPLFRALGERADIVWVMRQAMIPLYGLSLGLIYTIGANVFSKRAGLWSAMLLGLQPTYFFMMGQFRTDVLWTVLWLAVLAVLTAGELTGKRLFFTGLLIGAAFSVSMKTTLLLLVLLGAGAGVWIARRRCVHSRTASFQASEHGFGMWLCGLSGLLVIPALIVAFFAAKGALGPMYYCVIEHNTLPGDQTPGRLFFRLASRSWLAVLPAALAVWAIRSGFSTAPGRTSRQTFLIVAAALFYPVLHGFWRMITRQDYVPWFPLLCLVAVPGILWLEKWIPKSRVPVLNIVLLCLVVAEVRAVLHHAPLLGNPNVRAIQGIADTLRLTKPWEHVMDPKGDLIFRPRPYYYVLETLTRMRIAKGLISDDVPECLTATQTAVIKNVADRLTPRALAFVRANYVPVGRLAVLGKRLPDGEVGGVVPFEITIPAQYSLACERGAVQGTMDGSDWSGSRWLEAGQHEFRRSAPASSLVLIWSRALEKGFTPKWNVSARRAEEQGL